MAFLFVSAGLVFQSCSAKIDKKGLENVTNLASSLPALMEKATSKYSDNEAAVGKALAQINDAYEHSKGMKKNTEVTEQWRIFKDEIAGPYFDRWKSAGKLDKDFIKESVKQVRGSLDAIKKAEQAKKKK